MKESWIRKATESIQDKAEFVFELCKEIAEEQHLELDWVVTVFKTRFNNVVKERLGE